MSHKSNFEILHDPALNKSLAFSHEEREKLGLRGLLPFATSTQQLQIKRVLNNLERKNSDIERYIFLSQLEDRNERLYYQLIIEHIQEIMPLIYTPTVGQACKEFSQNFRQAKGFYINPNDKGHIHSMLDNWKEDDIRTIVITDGQRILGLGDLGANGMGIPIGKLALYSACAGIDPRHCLPVMFDIGTNNEELRHDPLYLGYPHPRIDDEAYFELMDEFIQAVQDKFPKALIQFEDFLAPKAFKLLKKYQNNILCFNDDIQGTGSVALAGLYAAHRISGVDFADLKILFLGAGSASTGMANIIVSALQAEGISLSEARQRFWFFNKEGLINPQNPGLQDFNLPFAHDIENMSIEEAIATHQPHAIIGATGAPGSFTQSIVEAMSTVNERPIIFALSNPTSKAECTAAEAYQWSHGRAIFASGSPFDPVEYHEENNTTRAPRQLDNDGSNAKNVSLTHTRSVLDGTDAIGENVEHSVDDATRAPRQLDNGGSNAKNVRVFHPRQGNNAYVFPGIGLGALACQARTIPDELFFTAARALAYQVDEQDLEHGSIYPPLEEIRSMSLAIATAVAEKAYELGIAQLERPANLTEYIKSIMYDPTY